MADIRLTIDATVPANDSTKVTLYEDVDGDQSGGNTDPNGKNYENKAQTSALSDGENDYVLSGFDASGANQYWCHIEYSNSNRDERTRVKSLTLQGSGATGVSAPVQQHASQTPTPTVKKSAFVALSANALTSSTPSPSVNKTVSSEKDVNVVPETQGTVSTPEPTLTYSAVTPTNEVDPVLATREVVSGSVPGDWTGSSGKPARVAKSGDYSPAQKDRYEKNAVYVYSVGDTSTDAFDGSGDKYMETAVVACAVWTLDDEEAARELAKDVHGVIRNFWTDNENNTAWTTMRPTDENDVRHDSWRENPADHNREIVTIELMRLAAV